MNRILKLAAITSAAVLVLAAPAAARGHHHHRHHGHAAPVAEKQFVTSTFYGPSTTICSNRWDACGSVVAVAECPAGVGYQLVGGGYSVTLEGVTIESDAPASGQSWAVIAHANGTTDVGPFLHYGYVRAYAVCGVYR